ncbi:hypothetical protein GCM10017687_49510 [Streptomyces echinatus]
MPYASDWAVFTLVTVLVPAFLNCSVTVWLVKAWYLWSCQSTRVSLPVVVRVAALRHRLGARVGAVTATLRSSLVVPRPP